MDHIKSARVHLVLPKREMFSREEQMPTASVVIKTDGGKLSLESIHSIQQLIAAAVPKLDVKNVSIVDSAGNLLTNNFEDEEAVTVANNEALRLEQERKMSLQVQNLLEKKRRRGQSSGTGQSGHGFRSDSYQRGNLRSRFAGGSLAGDRH